MDFCIYIYIYIYIYIHNGSMKNIRNLFLQFFCLSFFMVSEPWKVRDRLSQCFLFGNPSNG